MKELYRYYCIHRPAVPGAIPRGIVNITDCDPQEYIPEIGQGAYSIVSYDHPLTKKEVWEYELTEART